MVEAFVGHVGGGKSYCSMRRMMSYIAAGGRCASNIRPVGWCDRLSDLCPFSPVRPYLFNLGWVYQKGQFVYIPFDDMVASAEWFKRIPSGVDREHRTLLVCDEATDLFDNLDRDKARADSIFRELLRFLRLSRHAHIDVLFICQDLSAINSRLRGLVAGIWRSTDMRNFRLARLKVAFPFDLFMLQKFDRSGKVEIQREWVSKDKKVFGIYESESFGQSVGVKWDGVAVDVSKGRVQQKKGLKMIWKVLILCAVFGQLLFGYVVVRSGGLSDAKPVCTNTVERVTIVSNVSASAASTICRPSVVRGVWEFSQAGEEKWGFFDGCRIDLGAPCEWGTVAEIGKNFVRVLQGDGTFIYLMPVKEIELNAPSVVASVASNPRGKQNSR